jgi:hypothetical protein
MGVLKTIVSAMQAAAESGGFGDLGTRDRLFIYFDITDSELATTTFEVWARRFNTSKMAIEFQQGPNQWHRLFRVRCCRCGPLGAPSHSVAPNQAWTSGVLQQ